MKKTVEIFDEENSIIVNDDRSQDTFTVYPDKKRFEYESSIKDDCFYNYLTYEYKIFPNPTEVHTRLLEKSYEPPKTWLVKDGVVLDAELSKEEHLLNDEQEIVWLKKETEWHRVELLSSCELNFFILSKHPEVISHEDYRRLLRQSEQRIKMGLIKVDEALKSNKRGLEIYMNDDVKYIWYPHTEEDKKEWDEYIIEWGKSIESEGEKYKKNAYEKKIEYVEKFTNTLFLNTSSNFVGITKNEFRESSAILSHIEKLLDENASPLLQKGEVEVEKTPSTNRLYSIVVYSLTVLFIILKLTDGIDWNWFGVLSPILIWEGLGFISGFMRGYVK